MNLLTPEHIKNSKKQGHDELQVRIRKLADEESKLLKRVNALQTEDAAKRESILSEFELFRSEMEAKRDNLLKEVHSLEERRTRAMQPVLALQEEAQNVLEENNQTKKLLKAEAEKLAEREQCLIERVEALRDRDQEVAEREEAATQREANVLSEESRLKTSAEKLAKNWVEYHKAVHDTNSSLEERERALTALKLANEARATSLDQKEAQLQQHEIQIKDRYATLARAQAEILGKQS